MFHLRIKHMSYVFFVLHNYVELPEDRNTSMLSYLSEQLWIYFLDVFQLFYFFFFGWGHIKSVFDVQDHILRIVLQSRIGTMQLFLLEDMFSKDFSAGTYDAWYCFQR